MIKKLLIGSLLLLAACSSESKYGYLNQCNAGDISACSKVEDLTSMITNEEYKSQQQESASPVAAIDPDLPDPNVWSRPTAGVYVRPAENDCDLSSKIGSGPAFCFIVWAKDRSADIYSKGNVINNQDVVVGWTNDTLYLDKGQQGQLLFEKPGLEGSGPYSFKMTEFVAR